METTTYAGQRELERIQARAAQAEASRTGKKEDALATIAIDEARDAARDRERRRKEQAKTRKLEDKAKRREKRAAARKTRNERIAATLGHPLPWVMTVVITSIGFAFPGQFNAVADLGVFWVLALLVPVFTEGSTWAMAWLRKWAIENDKPATLYSIMTWLFASVAAALNAWHHADRPELAVVFATSSLFGVGVFEIYMHSQQHRVGGKSAAEIRLAFVRRLRHPRVARRAAWLRSAAGMTLEQAWDTAWRQLYGCAPGVTKRILKRFNKQTEKVADLVQEHGALASDASLTLFAAPPERVHVLPADKAWAIRPEAIDKILTDPAYGSRAGRQSGRATKIEKVGEGAAKKAAQSPQAGATRAANGQVKPNNPPSSRGREKGAEKGGVKVVRAARALAAETARAATPEQAEAEKRAAREWVLEKLRADREIKWSDVRDYFAKEVPDLQQRMVRGETWCRARVKEAEAQLDEERAGDSSLHLVAANS